MSDTPRIETLERLEELRQARKAVRCPDAPNFRRMPAAFALNLSGAILLRLFRSGMYEYDAKAKEAA